MNDINLFSLNRKKGKKILLFNRYKKLLFYFIISKVKLIFY